MGLPMFVAINGTFCSIGEEVKRVLAAVLSGFNKNGCDSEEGVDVNNEALGVGASILIADEVQVLNRQLKQV